MNTNKNMTIQQKLIEKINSIDGGDDNIALLKKVAYQYCCSYELCEGYKHALINEINDQFENHFNDVDQNSDALDIYKMLT